MKIGDLVHYPDAPIRTWEDEEPLSNGIVVGFDPEDDPIVFFFVKMGQPHIMLTTLRF